MLGVEYDAETQREADAALLMEVLDLREEVEQLRAQRDSEPDPQALSRLRALHALVAARLSALQTALSDAFADSDWTVVKARVGELAYFGGLEQRIRQLLPVQ